MMRRTILAVAVLALACGAARAQDAGRATGTSGVVSRVQFIGPMVSLSEGFREGVRRTARRVRGVEGCGPPCVRLQPGMRVTVRGHSFFPATEDTDPSMRSQIRANLVRDLLVEGGIPAERIWTVGCGDVVPWSVNDERVEIVIEPEGAQPTCGE